MSAPSNPDRVGVFAILAGTAIIAWSPLLARFLDVGPVAGGGWRMAFSLPILGAWALRNARAAPERAWARGAAPERAWARGAAPALVLAGLFFACDVASFHLAVGATSIANATFIGNLSPLLAMVGGALLFAEHPRPAVWAALALSLAGSWTMAGFAGPTTMGAGDAFALAASFAYAGYMLAVKSARARLDGAAVTFWSALCAAPVLFAAAALRGEAMVPASARGWAVVLTLGLVSHALGQGLTSVALGRAPVALVALVVLAQPPVSALLAWGLLHEPMSARQMLGGAIILAAVVLGRPR